ncbi:MAG: tRNA (adenosine(37)-N6)-threonylcarbamoyltransferase complex ATPase subunit type 1 TsaE [Gammaproteobacteria bacterium]
MKRVLRDEVETLELGAKMFRMMSEPLRIYLSGELGSGKTTLVRGFLRGAGYLGPVRSPTFTLVEEYALSKWKLVHFDLYRLADPEELEWIGIRDYLEGPCVWFVEWPERGLGSLPVPDLSIDFSQHGEGRYVCFEAQSDAGRNFIQFVLE